MMQASFLAVAVFDSWHAQLQHAGEFWKVKERSEIGRRRFELLPMLLIFNRLRLKIRSGKKMVFWESGETPLPLWD